MNRCETCQHFQKKPAGMRAGDAIGECHAKPPVRDYAWPKVRTTDHCSDHSAETVAFATANDSRRGNDRRRSPGKDSQQTGKPAEAQQ